MKSYNKLDLLFIAIIVSAFSVAAWLLYSGDQTVSTGAHSEQVGTITYKNHFAERKVNGEVIWGGLVQSAPVYNEDTVRTTTDSSAKIKLINQTEISLGEKTMVLVSVAKQATSINVTGGLVSVRQISSGSGGGSSGKPVILKTQSGSVTMDSGAVSLSDIAGHTAVSVESGNATVASGSKTQEVGVNSVVSFNGADPVAMNYVPVTPQTGATLFLTNEAPKVSFKWLAPKTVLSNQTVALVIANDSDFKDIIHQEKVAGTELSVQLPEGTLYWKLVANGAETPPHWFNILVQRPPRILEPAENKQFSYDESLPLVRFAWIPMQFASAYRVEIYSGNATETPLLTKTTTLANLAIDSLKQGDYAYRVVAISGEKAGEFASGYGHFAIKNDRLIAPTLLSPAGSSSSVGAGPSTAVSSVASGNGAALASWQEVDGADSYHADISRDSAGKEIVASVETSSNSLRLDKALGPGTYYVRVSAVSGRAHSTASKPLVVQVVAPYPLQALVPVAGSTLDPGDRPFPVRWSDPNGGNKYRVIFSHNASLAQPFLNIESAAAQTAIDIPNDQSGTIFWRADLLDGSGRTIISSAVSTFYLPQLFKDPQPLQPLDGEQVDVFFKDTFSLRWQVIPGARDYKVTMYRMSGGLKTAIQSWTTEKTVIKIDDFTNLSTDAYAWDLSAINYSGTQLLGQSRTVMSYFRIIQSRPVTIPAKINFGTGSQQ